MFTSTASFERALTLAEPDRISVTIFKNRTWTPAGPIVSMEIKLHQESRLVRGASYTGQTTNTRHNRASEDKEPQMLEGSTKMDSGLEYIDDVVGEGDSPRMDQQVTVHYTGKLADTDKVFD